MWNRIMVGLYYGLHMHVLAALLDTEIKIQLHHFTISAMKINAFAQNQLKMVSPSGAA